MNYELTIIILFLIASFISIIAKKYNLPYTIALVAFGLALGSVHLLNPPKLTQELLYAIFLPPLIFEAAIHIKSSDLFKDIWLIVTLVIPGVVFFTLLTAAVLSVISLNFIHINITWPVALLFGAAVAATDPVSVVSIFKSLGAPKRLTFLIESESLLNDGTSIVVFLLVLNYINGHIGSMQSAVFNFFIVVGAGLFIGSVIGLFTDEIMKKIDDPMIAITLTTIAAYSSFLIADRFGVSGVMSTVAAGLICGEKGFSSIFPSIRLATETFWEYIAFAMNSLIFLLMGFSVNLNLLWKLWPVIIIAYIAVLIARFFVVGSTWTVFYPTKYKFPFSWTAVLTWGGLRGALSMVLALSLPDSFKYKNIIVALVFGVVLLSIFIQGLTMSPLLKILRLASPTTALKDYETLKTQIRLFESSIDRLETLYKKHLINKATYEAIKNEYLQKIDELSKQLEEIKPDPQALKTEEFLKLQRRLLTEQKSSLLDMYQNGIISYEVYRNLEKEIDNRLFELENTGA